MDEITTSAEGNVDRVVYEEFFKGKPSGVFVDVGAARPDFLSISALYRAIGWRVLAIEPNAEFCELHRARGHEVLQYACGERDEDNVDFTIVDSHGCDYRGGSVSFESFSSLGVKDSYATLKPNLDARAVKVNVRRLDTILETHANDVQKIDIVSVDVEGWELEVLNGLSFRKYTPRVLIIENYFNDPAYWRYMEERGYALWRVIEPNDVYIYPGSLKRFAEMVRKSLSSKSRRRRAD